MRRLIFTMMIALLLLRGWAGDAMATQMAAHGIAGVPVATTPGIPGAGDDRMQHSDSHPAATVLSDSAQTSPMHHGNGSDCMDDSRLTQSNPSVDCEDCPACQACHTVAVTHTRTARAALPYCGTTLTDHSAQFASADAALGQKPPIS